MTRGSRSGRTYRVYRGIGGRLLNRPRLHTASTANELPGVISGNYRKSIDFLVKGSSRLEFGAGTRGLADYAVFLEKGTSKMTARRPLRKTVKKLGNQVNTNITKEINNNITSLGFKITKI